MTTFVATSARGRRCRTRITFVIALLLSFALVVGVAPAEARTSRGGG